MMALVCDDNESNAVSPIEEKADEESFEDSKHDETSTLDNPDLEDGEIEDDGDEEAIIPPVAPSTDSEKSGVPTTPKEKRDERRHDRERRGRHDEKKKHMTEAEKSILHLRKRERLQREKWEKFRKEQNIEPQVDDFAINLEKALASVLKKDKHSEEERDDDVKRSRKRKHRDKDKQKGGNNKQRKLDSPAKTIPIIEEQEESENDKKARDQERSPTRSDDSYESEYSSDANKSEERRERKKDYKKNKGRNRERRRRSRERRNQEQQQQQQQLQFKDSQGVCVFFLQGKCQKNDCPYSHEAMPPMKLELCKFYLKDCCAKGEKCSYMHSEFPCKFYHTGLVCLQNDDCKFAHGGPLDEHRRQILFKHIETAPREILGGFPRMSREETLNKINLTQQNLIAQYGSVVENNSKTVLNLFDINVAAPLEANTDGIIKQMEKPLRQRPSRWQDPEPVESSTFIPPFVTFPPNQQDCDMRINSNGDIDMRTLPPPTQLTTTITTTSSIDDVVTETSEQNFTQDIDIRNPSILQFDTKDIDIRQQPIILPNKDVDIRQIPLDPGPPVDLPKTQRDLYMRIQNQQKTNVPTCNDTSLEIDEDNINWYSDDDDDDENRLTIKVDNEEENKESVLLSPTNIKPQEVVEKLGDLSKIDISAEVTKLLTSMSQQKIELAAKVNRDPRQRTNQDSNDGTVLPTLPKLSIYEQGSIVDDSGPKSPDEIVEGGDLLRSRPDVDLRNLNLPFKGMLNYTPAKEIDASVKSHLPMIWKVEIVDIPRPDYTGLKLNIVDAEKTGDPRLRKIFRLSTEEKDSPASPKASPKSGGGSGTTRIDPRLKKTEEHKPDATTMSYNQQLNILHTSPFFQSLTSNQKLLLNQELANRNEQNGINDPVLGSMLNTLNLVPNTTNLTPSPNIGAALNILANVNNLNNPPTLMRPNQGLLGAAPGIPNDYPAPPQMNFNNHQNQFGNYPNENFGGGFVDDWGGGGPPNQPPDNFRENRGFNRDRRRGRNHFNRNNGNRNFRNRNHNRHNRGHTPP